MSFSYLIESVSNCAATFADAEENPQNWQTTCRDLGNLLQGMGRFEDAITWHSLALDSQPNIAEIHAQLGRLFAQEENWDAAIAFFENALKSIPNSVQIYSNLAQIYGQIGKRDLETDCWYKAVELNPDLVNAQGYYKLGRAFEERGKIDRAIDCYHQACDRDTTLLAAHYKLAEKRLRQGDFDSAKVCFENIIKQDFNQYDAHHQLGIILSRQGQFEAASQEFRHTIKIAPDLAGGYPKLVKALMQQQKWDEAISTCHSIINLVEEFPWIYSLLGDALRAKGKVTEAVEAYQKACSARGWQEAVTNNYFFPVDQLTHRMALFETHIVPLANQEKFSALEVGNDFGMSACWLLDKILTHPSAKLTCVDHLFNKKLEENLVKTGAREKVILLEHNIPKHLEVLKPQSFDLAHLQEQQKQWEYAGKNTALVWKTIKVGGMIIIESYGWQNPHDPDRNVKKGVDIFLDSIKGKWEVVAHYPRAFQLVIRKIAKSEDEE